ncbi:MAG: 30S ribosomal protein S1 [Candidatus Binatia bacterium]
MSESNPSSKASRGPLSPTPVAEGEDDFAALFEASHGKAGTTGAKRPVRAKAGDLVSCRVIAIGQSSVFVNVGDKAEGTIDLAEFRDPSTGEFRVAVGDQIQATILDDGAGTGSAVLTRMLGRGGHAAAELEQAQALGVPVEGTVTAETKGGFEVHIGSVRAFCPGSQIDLRRGPERVPASEYLGKKFAFRVTKVENDGRNVVVSRRDILEEEAAQAATKTWEQIRVGAVLEGTVRSIRDFGAFVDLGGVDGMIHVSELSFTRVNHPQEILTVGQKVKVQVLRVADKTDKDGRRQVALSMRALAEDPWTTLDANLPVGTTTSGLVKRVEAYGAFIEVLPGVEGLVHVSKMATDRRLSHARQAATVGQSVEVTVLVIDAGQRRLSLSMVEKERGAREAEEAEDKREQDKVMAGQQKGASLGTFGDLLAEARRK